MSFGVGRTNKLAAVFRGGVADGKRFAHGVDFAPLLIKSLLEDLQHHVGAVKDLIAAFVCPPQALLYPSVNGSFVIVSALVQTD
jgi:hypothetical protein